jgi:hypothetical protein
MEEQTEELTKEYTRYNVGKWRAEQNERVRDEERAQARRILHSDYEPPEYAEVVLAELRIDPRYQRARSENKVNTLRARFQPNACQPLSVSCRKNGTRYLVDGQHRAAVLQDIGMKGWMALLYHNLTPRDEAAMWKEMNTRQTKPRVGDRFKAGLVTRESEPCAILDVVTGAGMKINFKSGRNAAVGGTQISAIEALETIYRQYKAPVLADVLKLLQLAWTPDDTCRTSRPILLGLAAFLTEKWKNPVQLARAGEKLGTYPATKWIAKTRSGSDGTPAEILRAAFRNQYNAKAKRTEKL